MRFGRCHECNKYKYLKESSQCPTCLNDLLIGVESSTSIDIEPVNSSFPKLTIKEDVDDPDYTITVQYVGHADALKVAIKQQGKVEYCGRKRVDEKLEEMCTCIKRFDS